MVNHEMGGKNDKVREERGRWLRISGLKNMCRFDEIKREKLTGLPQRQLIVEGINCISVQSYLMLELKISKNSRLGTQ